MKKAEVNRWDGGIAESPNTRQENEVIFVKHFDIYTDPHRLIPAHGMDSTTTSGTNPTDFVKSGDKVYALCNDSASTGIVLSVLDPIATDTTWADSANSSRTGSSDKKMPGCLGIYDGRIIALVTDAAGDIKSVYSHNPGVSNTTIAVANTLEDDTANPTLGADGKFYVPYGRYILQMDSGTNISSDPFITIDDAYEITSTFSYGSYLGVAIRPTVFGTGVNSKVLLFDLGIIDQVNAASIIDFGPGLLFVADVIEGTIVGITNDNLDDADAVGKASLTIREWDGGNEAIVKKVIRTNASTGYLRQKKVVEDNKIFFLANLPTENGTYTGVFSWGRQGFGDERALAMYVSPEDATTLGGLGKAGDMFLVHDSSTTTTVYVTDIDDAYPYTSLVDTAINPNMDEEDREKEKQLVKVRMTYDAIPSGGQIVLKYKIDNDASWTTIFTETTEDKTYTEYLVKKSEPGRDIKFEFESTGGVKPRTLEYFYRTLKSSS